VFETVFDVAVIKVTQQQCLFMNVDLLSCVTSAKHIGTPTFDLAFH